MKSIPKVVVWDQVIPMESEGILATPGDDDVWDTMKNIESDSDEEELTRRKER